MKLEKIINFFQFENSKLEILGTYADENLKYYSDIDFESNIYYNHKTIKPLVNFFKRIYNDAIKKNIYITDLKAGVTLNGINMKWSLDDINRGYKVLDNHNVFHFFEVFTQKSIIKYDFICLLDGVFTEFSCNYYIYFNEPRYDTTPISTNDLSISFYLDFKKYLNEKMYFKAVKRLYKFFITVEDKVNVNRMVKFLNSDVGLYSYILSHLQTLEDVIKIDDNIPINTLKTSLKIVLRNTKFVKYTDRLTEKNQIILLKNTIFDMLNPKIEQETLNFLHSKIKSKDIIFELYKNKSY